MKTSCDGWGGRQALRFDVPLDARGRGVPRQPA
jgi:hypothetical protein